DEDQLLDPREPLDHRVLIGKEQREKEQRGEEEFPSRRELEADFGEQRGSGGGGGPGGEAQPTEERGQTAAEQHQPGDRMQPLPPSVPQDRDAEEEDDAA